MVNPKKYGVWAVVLGAAEGIGEAFCRELASRGMNILMVDIQEELIKKLSHQLIAAYQIKTKVIIQDLADEKAAEIVTQEIRKIGGHLVIYNAAYGPVKKFIQNSSEEIDRYLNLNCRTPIHLIHQLVPFWTGKPSGIIIMSSLAGLFGVQLVAPYSASKAFDVNLGEALYHELKPSNIDVLVCCAGATDTPNFRKTNPNLSITFKPHIAKPGKVAKEALDNIGKKALHIAGFKNRLNYFLLSRVLPRKFASVIFNSTMKSLYPNV